MEAVARFAGSRIHSQRFLGLTPKALCLSPTSRAKNATPESQSPKQKERAALYPQPSAMAIQYELIRLRHDVNRSDRRAEW